MEFQHAPVLLHECIEALNIQPDGIYLDGTLGGAGHSREIAARLSEAGMLIGVDRDPAALQAAGERLSSMKARILLVHENFQNLREILNQAGVDRIDGMLFDLGVSSPQLDEAERGFSYMNDALLDMRMNPEDRLSAYEVVNDWPQEELKRILFDYGEERYAPLIAAAIVRERAKKPIETTLELSAVIRGAMPAQALREKQHPAKRSFQAIRIAVNDELGAVERMMEAAPDLLKPGGRLAVITFHSLEDRIVKNAMQTAAKGCICPPSFPVCVCGRKPSVRILTKKPITSQPEELEENPRARSAKLRVAEKL
ncbi:MAG: 16S rRNA (cytosine(1402)-N(4))-methyltransferase RsmH [Oscillospiraceae bacterium]|nr:16S rRNA (cytosine(1402)-N(4))-methyltransferase RsmH [Oscillospiraceae bacterium]